MAAHYDWLIQPAVAYLITLLLTIQRKQISQLDDSQGIWANYSNIMCRIVSACLLDVYITYFRFNLQIDFIPISIIWSF